MQVSTTLQTDNHASTPTLSFLQAGCPSCRPTNSVKALKAVKTLETSHLGKYQKTKPGTVLSQTTTTQQPPFHGHYTGQPALADTSS